MTATAFGPALVPIYPSGMIATGFAFPLANDALLLDADEEEAQQIGYVQTEDGASHTFGTSSKIDWLSGASITFQATATLRVGIKKASVIDAAAGPPVRATAGTAAFNVWKDLIGGTDTITNTTWQSTSMDTNDGANVTVNNGDLIAICHHLDIGANAQSVKVRTTSEAAGALLLPAVTLITAAGATFTAQSLVPVAILTFDDGALGWLYGGVAFNVSSTATTIGNTVIYGNVITPTVPITVDAYWGSITLAGTTNVDVGVWLASDPSAPISSVSVDPQQASSALARTGQFCIPPVDLAAGTAYVYGVKQNSATAIQVPAYDVFDTTHLQVNGLDANCHAVTSTGGAAFAQLNSGKRRLGAQLRIRKFSDGAGGSGGNANILRGSVVA